MRQAEDADRPEHRRLGMGSGPVDNRARPPNLRGRKDPRQRTTPARGGGGRGRHVSAPGGRAETHRYENRVPMTIHTVSDSLQAQQSHSRMSVLLLGNKFCEIHAPPVRYRGNAFRDARIFATSLQRLLSAPSRLATCRLGPRDLDGSFGSPAPQAISPNSATGPTFRRRTLDVIGITV